MAFTTGMQALQDVIAQSERRSEAARAAGSGKSIGYINWKPRDKKILRFLTDDIITADFHNFIIDKSGQTKNFMIDPADPNRLDRYRSPVPGVGWHKDYKTQQLKDPVTTRMTACVAVLRTEKPGPDGKMVVEDVITDRDVNGTPLPSRTFGVVLQNSTSFWPTLTNYWNRYGSICDRDFEITRLDTSPVKYDIIPLPVLPELDTPEKVAAFYFYGHEWDENDANRFLKCPQTVAQWAEYYGSEDRYKYWLTAEGSTPAAAATASPGLGGTTTSTTGLGEFSAATTSNPGPADEAQAMPSSGTKFSSLRDTLLHTAEQQKK